MPLTRNKTQATTPGQRSTVKSSQPTPQSPSSASKKSRDSLLSSSLAVTRSGRVIQQPHQDDPNPRSAKRQRTESYASPQPKIASDDVQTAPQKVESTANNPGRGQHGSESEKIPTNGIPTTTRYPLASGKSGRPNVTKSISRMKVESLPILDNLSTQVLCTLAKSTPQEITNLISTPDAESGRDFATVRSLFDHTKKVYVTTTPFLSPRELEIQRPEQIEILRKANFATFFSSILTGDLDLQDLNGYFLDVFVPENGRLLKAQASILLDLKTQAFLATTTQSPNLSNEALSQYFPENMEDQLLGKRPGAKTLVPSEQDFVKRLMSRRDILLAEINNETLNGLTDRYKWEDFMRDVSSYLSKNFETICPLPDKDKLGGRLVSANMAKGLQQGEMEGQFSIHGSPNPLPEVESVPLVAVAPLAPTPPPQQPTIPFLPPEPPQELQQEDFVAKAARAAQIALEGQSRDYSFPNPYHDPQPPQYSPPLYQQSEPSFQHYNPPLAPSSPPRSHNSNHDETRLDLPHSSQTAPTQVLYERARMAATAKASPGNRKTSTPSQRRPWTTEEENALMAGLDRVRGPHWSQILAMFGPGGTINESLKDRNQVQLKDKARNLKLFFLKSGIEVPYYLKYVTGDLRTRAPAQASKQEARERERQQGLEDKAHFDGVQGIMALAGAHSQQPEDSNSLPLAEQSQSMDSPLPEAHEMEPLDMDPELRLDHEFSDQKLGPAIVTE